MPVQKTCVQCGKNFLARRQDADTRKFCGPACYRAHEAIHGRPNAPHAERITFSCQTCGNPIVKTEGELRAYRKTWGKDPVYCSRKCTYKGMRLKDEAWQANCVVCGKPMPIQRKPGGTINRLKRLCSTECRSRFRHEGAMKSKKAGRRPTHRATTKQGYITLSIPAFQHPSGERTIVFEHRWKMEQKLGRPLRAEETVHHRNGDRSDNGDANLELFNSKHGPGQRVIDKIEWAIELMRAYPDFTRDAGYELKTIDPIEHLHQLANAKSA